MEGVDQAEGQLVVVILAVDRLVAEVTNRVVHPAHVPLEAEAQAAQVGGPRDARPGGRFLGDREDAGELQVRLLVQLLEEADGLQVLAAAELVGQPVARLAAVVEIEHRGHGIDPQAVDVVLVEPEQGVGDEEVADLVAAVVEDQRAPVAMLAAAGIGMLVQGRAVELPQAVAVAGEVGGNPVEDHADVVLVAEIDEIHQVVRRAVAAGGRIVAHGLIAPTGRQRVLAHRQQLEVRVVHLLAVIDELVGQLAIGQPPRRIVARPLPTAQVDLIAGDRPLVPVGLAAVADPVGVVPMVAIEIDDLRGRPRRHFGGEAVGIGLLENLVVVPDLVLVERAFAEPGDEQFPEAAGNVLSHRVPAAVPMIEVADDAHARGVGRPDGEIDAFHAVDRPQVGAEAVIALPVPPLVEQVHVVLGQEVRKGVRIVDRGFHSYLVCHSQHVS